jgi:hypothetical protein
VAGRAVRPGVPWDRAPIRLISLIKSEPIAKKILVAIEPVIASCATEHGADLPPKAGPLKLRVPGLIDLRNSGSSL